MTEFGWWLLIVGLVLGAGLVWLVLADSARRDAEVDARELPAEAAWIADAMGDMGRPIDPGDAEEVLRLHRAYLAAPPPDALVVTIAEPDAEPAEPVEATDVAPAAPPEDAGSARRTGPPSAELDAGTHR